MTFRSSVRSTDRESPLVRPDHGDVLDPKNPTLPRAALSNDERRSEMKRWYPIVVTGFGIGAAYGR